MNRCERHPMEEYCWKKYLNKNNPTSPKASLGTKYFSFLDGPITANNPMGVHHAWGRTYKDIFQRYFAMRGFDERFQNGFDCQGLWVEVEVEKDLGFNTKKHIENYGLEKFSEACRKRVEKYSKIQTQQSIRLGQWMHWDNSYYTLSDNNIEHIWYFLKKLSLYKIWLVFIMGYSMRFKKRMNYGKGKRCHDNQCIFGGPGYGTN